MANLWQKMGEAIADIRTKLLEEPMWGRAVTEQESTAPQWPEASQQQAFGSVEHSIERNPPDMEMDR